MTTYPALEEYVARLERSLSAAPAEDRAEAVAGVRSYVEESVADDPTLGTDAGIRTLLDRFGSPEEIAAGYAGAGAPRSAPVAGVDPALADAVAARIVEGRQATAAKIAVAVAGICLLLSPIGVLFPVSLLMIGIAAWGIGRRPAQRRAYVITAVLAGLAALVPILLWVAVARSESVLGPEIPGISHVESSTSVTSVPVTR